MKLRLRTVVTCVVAFSCFALVGTLAASKWTFALWSDHLDVNRPLVIQPSYVKADVTSVNALGAPDTSLLVPVQGNTNPQALQMSKNSDGTWSKTPSTTFHHLGPNNPDYATYSYVGAEFTWDTQASYAQIVQQIRDNPSRNWYGVTAVAQITAESYGALSWAVVAQWDPKQDLQGSTMWDKSWSTAFLVADPSNCVIDSNYAEGIISNESFAKAPVEIPKTGPEFSEGALQGFGPQTLNLCVTQIYVPSHHTNTATATAPNTNDPNTPWLATDSWSAVIYDLQPEPQNPPRLGLYITPVDPLNGPATDPSSP